MNWGRRVVSSTGNAMKVDCYCQIAIMGASMAHMKAPWSLIIIIINNNNRTITTTITTTCLRTDQCHKYKTLKLTPSQAISAAVGGKMLWSSLAKVRVQNCFSPLGCKKSARKMAIMPFMPRGFKLKQQSRRDWASCGYMHHSDCFASTHDKNDDLEEF